MSNQYAHVVVCLPCYNEETSIAKVIGDFSRMLPGATIYVFDNMSTDDTRGQAARLVSTVFQEQRKGKGNVVRRMFSDIDADVYVLVDSDDTYDAAEAPYMIQLLCEQGLDMVVGVRKSSEDSSYRAGHVFGNRMLTRFIGVLFGRNFSDVLSGYRVMSRRFVKSFPAHSSGFEIESELAIHALELNMPIAEVPTRYRSRPPGSESKLRTWSDGARIAMTIIKLFKDEKPFTFFSIASLASALLSIGLAVPIVRTWLATGLVPRFPTAILCAALMVMAVVFLASGLILDTVTRGRIEAKRLAYLSISGPLQYKPSA